MHISVGPKILQQVTESLQAHLGETEIPSVRPNLLGFLAVAISFETRWRRIERIGRAEFDFWFRTYLEVRKWLGALEHITKHFEQASH